MTNQLRYRLICAMLLLVASLVAVSFARGQVLPGPGFLIKTYSPSLTFLDSSPGNATITRNGNVTQGNAGVTAGKYSGLFDGNADFLTYTNQAFTGDFTAECWYFQTANTTNYSIIFGATSNVQLNVKNNGAIEWIDNGAVKIASAGTASQNVWNHFAWVRSGSTTYTFINGVQAGTATNSATVNTDRVGDLAGVGNGYSPTGRLALVRLSTVARYTANFTASSSYTSDANTTLFLQFGN